jgi:hypothetical protein
MKQTDGQTWYIYYVLILLVSRKEDDKYNF